MTPVQAAEREAMARFGAAQSIADIGQGAAFKQQQALADTGQAARAQVSQAVAQRDADVAQQQAEEKARLEDQQRQAKALERQAALSLVGGIGEAAAGAAGASAEYGMAKELYGKQIAELRGSAKATSQGTQNMLGIQAVEGARKPILGADGVTAVEGMEAPFNPLQGFEYVPPEPSDIELRMLEIAEELNIPEEERPGFFTLLRRKFFGGLQSIDRTVSNALLPITEPISEFFWTQRRKKKQEE